MGAVDQSTLDRAGVPHGTDTAASARPVVLATLSVRVDPVAERVAIEAALETRARLLLANMIWLPPHPTTLILAREYATLPHEEDLDAVRATADRAAALGIPTELLRISSRRPLAALIELVCERDAGLVVLGPDPRRSPRWWRALAARRIRRRADCLVWIAPDG
jgi:nucleotide-binding universal stress UspA family protein